MSDTNQISGEPRLWLAVFDMATTTWTAPTAAAAMLERAMIPQMLRVAGVSRDSSLDAPERSGMSDHEPDVEYVPIYLDLCPDQRAIASIWRDR